MEAPGGKQSPDIAETGNEIARIRERYGTEDQRRRGCRTNRLTYRAQHLLVQVRALRETVATAADLVSASGLLSRSTRLRA